MALMVQAIRGMNDLLPEDTSVWQQVEKVLRQTMSSYGYSEVRMPIVEKTNLFCRAIGEVTDVVEKEMYSLLKIDQVIIYPYVLRVPQVA